MARPIWTSSETRFQQHNIDSPSPLSASFTAEAAGSSPVVPAIRFSFSYVTLKVVHPPSGSLKIPSQTVLSTCAACMHHSTTICAHEKRQRDYGPPAFWVGLSATLTLGLVQGCPSSKSRQSRGRAGRF